jgi:hypothetical protein
MSAFGRIVLQKSKVEGLRIFRENTKREALADSYNLNRVTEVACEFIVWRWGPSHLYTKTAPVARRIFDHQFKTSFATHSGAKRTSRRERGQCVDRHDLKDEVWEFA